MNYAYFVHIIGGYSWFVRGGFYVNGGDAGVVSGHYAAGIAAVYYGSRVVVWNFLIKNSYFIEGVVG